MVLIKVHKDCYERNYNNGVIRCYPMGLVESRKIRANEIEEFIKATFGSPIFKDDNFLVTRIENSFGDVASSHELELWKNGTINLFEAEYLVSIHN